MHQSQPQICNYNYKNYVMWYSTTKSIGAFIIHSNLEGIGNARATSELFGALLSAKKGIYMQYSTIWVKMDFHSIERLDAAPVL